MDLQLQKLINSANDIMQQYVSLEDENRSILHLPLIHNKPVEEHIKDIRIMYRK